MTECDGLSWGVYWVLVKRLNLGYLKKETISGLLRNQGEKSINFYFIMVPLRKKY